MLKKRLSGSKFLLTLNAKLSTFSYLCGVESIKRLMKKKLIIAISALMTLPATLFGQSYDKLWKQVTEAQDKDLPQQVIKYSQQIVEKARKEREYGHLLKAQLTATATIVEVAPDSLNSELTRLDKEMRTANDGALKAVYATVLYMIYDERSSSRTPEIREKRDECLNLALADPALLARTKASKYEPFVVKGKDSRYFKDDLLSIIGRTLGNYEKMHEQYERMGNRPAACLTALWMLQEGSKPYKSDWRESEYIAKLDSLIGRYKDLDVVAEVALERYKALDDHTGADKGVLLDYIHEATARWKKWPRMNKLRNAELEMTNPKFRFDNNSELITSGTPSDINLSDLRNVQELTLNIYRTDLKGDCGIDNDDLKKKQNFQKWLMPELTQTHRYEGHPPYEEFRDTLHVPGLQPGVYMVELKTTPETETMQRLFYVSDLYVVGEELPGSQCRIAVVNSTTGQPVAGAHVKVSVKRDKVTNVFELTCDEKGEVIHKGDIDNLFAYTDSDNGFKQIRWDGRYSYYPNNRKESHIVLFTDRSIYRPGQTVHVAALAYENSNYIEHNAKENLVITFRLTDANYKTVAEKTVVADAFGKAATEFTLPTGSLNGRFTISANGGSTYFRVEEYKRPTYEVSYEEITQAYKAGDTIDVTGTARSYAGVGIQGAKVKYTVKRRIAYWWFRYSPYWDEGYIGRRTDDEEICEGETTTDAQGHFIVNVPLKVSEYERRSINFYHFVVDSEVTDQAGETRSGSMNIPVGTRDAVLTCDLPYKALKENLKGLTFHLYNAAGKDLEGETVEYRMDEGQWLTAKSNNRIPMDEAWMKSGRHQLEARCAADTLKQTMIVFSLDDTVPCEETKDWFFVSSTQFDADDSKPVTVQVGSSAKDVHMFYSIISGRNVIETGAVDQSNAIWNRKFTYKEEYGNGIQLAFAWVKDGKLYEHHQTIKRPLPPKKLTLRWDTFRDRLTPGQKEEWKLTVLNPDGTPADAQMMATMYDKSLDQLYNHQWSFTPYFTLPLASTYWEGSSWSRWWSSAAKKWERLDVPDFEFSHFDYNYWQLMGFGYEQLDGAVAYGGGEVMLRRSLNMSSRTDGAMLEEAVMVNKMSAVAETADEGETAEQPEEEQNGGVQMRENLNETAFFYPQFTTDKKGQIAIKFTLPESLTTWRFMGIATTKDIKYGYLDGEAIAQKEVMVQPNMPRFVRTGDQAKIATRIFNTADHDVSGTATLNLIDPRTNKSITKLNQPFSVKKGETGIVTFDVQPDGKYDLYICQISAAGKNFSDGEQHYLAVLPDKERVTVSVPFTQHEPGTKTIDIARLFPGGTTQQKLTVEYTNNPAWLMVQALPSVGNPREDDAIDQAAVLYSTLIARTLINQSADIKNVFEQWKREADQGSLTSNLSKNQELKDILLQETPWVVDADREDEQKQRLGDFFDENNIDNRIGSAVKKLNDLQRGDGSWSWWPGMQGSFYMTVSISEMLARLNVMAGQQNETRQMLNKAFDFMGKEILEDVADMKKLEKEGKQVGFPSFKALQYLYICAIDGRKLPKNVQEANDYLIGKMKQDIKNQTIYEKALSAIILFKSGDKKRGQEYAQSLKEYTVFTEEKGRYYDTRRAGYSWYDYKIPTEVMAIEALKVITPQDEQTVEEMQRWLLQEKRTQAWDTPINSVNAVYAFLFDNTKLLEAQKPTVLAIDGKKLDVPSTAGVGYVKTAIEQPKGKQFTAKKTSTGTSWGAVYAQFMQPVSDIENSASGITIKREVILISNPNNPTALTSPVTLKVGDKVKVRITITSERDLDFVQVLDRRAACMEPVRQLSGYRNGAYCSPKDYSTNYYYDMMRKGTHIVETEYYIDRPGTYETGTCTVQCAYSPEYRATTKSAKLIVTN